MKKLSLAILVAFVSIAVVACEDSKDLQAESSVDLGESQTVNANDSQSKSNESSADSHESQILDSQDSRESKKY